jgi:hypothetical protein
VSTGQLTGLTELGLQYNRLREVPGAVLMLSQLCNLNGWRLPLIPVFCACPFPCPCRSPFCPPPSFLSLSLFPSLPLFSSSPLYTNLGHKIL